MAAGSQASRIQLEWEAEQAQYLGHGGKRMSGTYADEAGG